MKDMRPTPHSSQLAELAKGRAPEGAEHRTRRRRRFFGVGMGAIALAVVVAPHLLDAHRISSVADRAAEAAGGSPVVGVGACPVALDESWILRAPAPVELASAVFCDYPAGRPGLVPSAGVVPMSQLDDLNADLRQHSVRDQPAAVVPHFLSSKMPEVRVLVGLTFAGQQVALIGSGEPGIYRWQGATPPAIWRPSSQTEQRLADDLAS